MTVEDFKQILSCGEPEELLETLKEVPPPEEVDDDVRGFEITLPITPKDIPLLISILEEVVNDDG